MSTDCVSHSSAVIVSDIQLWIEKKKEEPYVAYAASIPM